MKEGTDEERLKENTTYSRPGDRRQPREAIAWARGEDAPVKITQIEVPAIDVRLVRRKLRLSQSQFASRFGFAPASVKNREQGGQAGGPAPVLLAVIAKHSEAVEDALRPAS